MAAPAFRRAKHVLRGMVEKIQLGLCSHRIAPCSEEGAFKTRGPVQLHAFMQNVDEFARLAGTASLYSRIPPRMRIQTPR